jgi:hypothetical protein
MELKQIIARLEMLQKDLKVGCSEDHTRRKLASIVAELKSAGPKDKPKKAGKGK